MDDIINKELEKHENNMDDIINKELEKHEDCPFDTEGWDEIDIFLGNYGIDMRKMMSEIITE